MKGLRLLVVLLAALLAAHTASGASAHIFELMRQAMEATPHPQRGEQLYNERCARCHGPRGSETSTPKIPVLAAQREFYLVEQLVLFASLGRYVPEMHAALGGAQGPSAQDFRDIASYLARQARSAHTEHGDGRALSVGANVYTHQCTLCHGRNGEGSESEPIPAIAGQHYSYVLAQLRSFPAGHRGMIDPPVLDFTANLSDQERNAVADYISRLPGLSADQR